MTTTTDTYEAEYLELASRPGMEALRRECPFTGTDEHEVGCLNGVLLVDDLPWGREGDKHKACNGRGWLPLPQAKRLEMLMAVAVDQTIIKTHRRIQFDFFPDCATYKVFCQLGDRWPEGAQTPTAALTKAMLAVGA